MNAEGVAWIIRSEEQRVNFIQHCSRLPLPFMAKAGPVQHPKTLQQVRYAHSLCNALAIHHKVPLEQAKRDAKASFGVVVVGTSLITGERSARLVSFADYTKEQAEAFNTAMEVHLSEQGIDFIASGEGL